MRCIDFDVARVDDERVLSLAVEMRAKKDVGDREGVGGEGGAKEDDVQAAVVPGQWVAHER